MELIQSSLLLWASVSILGVAGAANPCMIFEDFLPYPNDCHYYIHCFSGRPYKKKCPRNLAFNPDSKNCDYPDVVEKVTGVKGCPHLNWEQTTTPNNEVAADDTNKVLLCYIREPHSRSGDKMRVGDIDPNLCTHVVAPLNSIDMEIKDIQQFVGRGDKYHQLNHLKVTNPRLKILVAVREADISSSLEHLDGNRSRVEESFNKLARWVRHQEFDGIDLPWYTPQNGTLQQFLALCTILHRALVEVEEKSTLDRLLLTARASGTSHKGLAKMDQKTRDKIFYQTLKVFRYLDWVTVESYDNHDGSFDKLAHGSLLHKASKHQNKGDFHSQNDIMYTWENMGAPRNKLVIGISACGSSFKMASLEQHSLGDPAKGPGKPGPYLEQPGTLSFPAICVMLEGQNLTRNWLKEIRVPVAYGYRDSEPEWVGYEDVQSMEAKADYILYEGLRGAMFWSLECDDHQNLCKLGRFPLVKALKDKLLPPPKKMDVGKLEKSGTPGIDHYLWVLVTTIFIMDKTFETPTRVNIP